MMARPRTPALAALDRRRAAERRLDPDAAARTAMSADGDTYEIAPTNPMLAINGLGHLDATGQSRAMFAGGSGPMADAQRRAQFVRNGVEMGPVWNEIMDLNRGRRATGAAPEYDPVGALSAAARQGAAYGNDARSRAVVGNARATDIDEGLRAHALSLAENGIDTERAAYRLGPDWQRSTGLADYQWGEPATTSFRRRRPR